MEVEPEAGPPPKRPRLAAAKAEETFIFMHHIISTDPKGRMCCGPELHLHPDGQISVGEGQKHGKWELRDKGALQLVWQYKAQSNVKTKQFGHIPNADSYTQIGCDGPCKAILIPKAT